MTSPDAPRPQDGRTVNCEPCWDFVTAHHAARSASPDPEPGLREAAVALARYPWGLALAGHNEEPEAMPLVNALRAALTGGNPDDLP